MNVEELALKNNSREKCIPSGHMVKRLYSALEVGHKTAKAVLSVLKQQTADRLGQSRQMSLSRWWWPGKQECAECIVCSARAKL